jgi:hypothetical protein
MLKTLKRESQDRTGGLTGPCLVERRRWSHRGKRRYANSLGNQINQGSAATLDVALKTMSTDGKGGETQQEFGSITIIWRN